jgi:hypothetical protein
MRARKAVKATPLSSDAVTIRGRLLLSRYPAEQSGAEHRRPGAVGRQRQRPNVGLPRSSRPRLPPNARASLV